MVEKRSAASRGSSFEQATKKLRRELESLARTVSPPPTQTRNRNSDFKSASAAIEAGEKDVQDPLAFYSSHLLHAVQPVTPGEPRLPHGTWVELYKKNAQSALGSHFVVHQHDHPVAGTHYDLRLQCNPTSSISFAIMYGLPGDPNSRRLNRNATETRVHCLWNHLVETASYSTGSMLIWDTGEYEILPYRDKNENEDITDDELDTKVHPTSPTEQIKLKRAFHDRKIKLRLHGTRLPPWYTLLLRLTKDNYRSEQPGKPSRRRQRDAPKPQGGPHTDSSGSDTGRCGTNSPKLGMAQSFHGQSEPLSMREAESNALESETNFAAASDGEDEFIRLNNAYIGANNDIGSIHQRKWYLSLDRKASGFARTVTRTSSGFSDVRWDQTMDERLANGVLNEASGFQRFLVGGRDTERSVITGRLAADILRDEGVAGYVPRGLWRPVTD